MHTRPMRFFRLVCAQDLQRAKRGMSRYNNITIIILNVVCQYADCVKVMQINA